MGGLRVGDGIAIDYPGSIVGPPPAIAYRDAAGGSTSTATDTVSATIPATVAAGDLLLAFVAAARQPADLAEEFYEGGTDGANQTTGNTIFSAFSTQVPTFDVSWSVDGALSGRYAAAGSSVYSTCQITATGTGSISWYLKFDALPAARTYLMNLQSSTTIRAQVAIDPDGTLLLRGSTSGTTLVAQATTALAAGGEYRIEYQVSGSTQSLQAYALHSTTPISGTSISGAYNANTFDRYLLGVTANSNIVVNVDAPRYSSTGTAIGPVVTTATTPAGWTRRTAITPVDRQTYLRGYVYSRTAQVGDASSTLSVVWSANRADRRNMHVVAYQNAASVHAEAAVAETVAGTTHTAPTVAVSATGCWVVEWMADRGNPGSTDLTVPSGFTERDQQASTGTSAITSSVGDTNGTVATGTRGGGTWTGTVSTSRAVLATLALAPAA